MKKIFKTTAGVLGFWCGIIIFLILNRIPSTTNQLSNITSDYGFPLVNYRTNLSSNYSTYIFWYSLLADIFFALLFSFLIGKLIELIQSKRTSNRSE